MRGTWPVLPAQGWRWKKTRAGSRRGSRGRRGRRGGRRGAGRGTTGPEGAGAPRPGAKGTAAATASYAAVAGPSAATRRPGASADCSRVLPSELPFEALCKLTRKATDISRWCSSVLPASRATSGDCVRQAGTPCCSSGLAGTRCSSSSVPVRSSSLPSMKHAQETGRSAQWCVAATGPVATAFHGCPRES
jgi:hypothetical protein